LCLTLYNLIWMATPVLVTIVMFYVFTKVQGNELTASIAFTSITIFNELRYVLANLPDVFMQGYQAIVSIRRIETFLNSGEIESQFVETNTSKVGFKNASVIWNKYKEDNEISSDEFVMKDLNIEFPIGKLSIVCKYLLFIIIKNYLKIEINNTFCLFIRRTNRIRKGNLYYTIYYLFIHLA
jgi:hypothetical protein